MLYRRDPLQSSFFTDFKRINIHALGSRDRAPVETVSSYRGETTAKTAFYLTDTVKSSSYTTKAVCHRISSRKKESKHTPSLGQGSCCGEKIFHSPQLDRSWLIVQQMGDSLRCTAQIICSHHVYTHYKRINMHSLESEDLALITARP